MVSSLKPLHKVLYLHSIHQLYLHDIYFPAIISGAAYHGDPHAVFKRSFPFTSYTLERPKSTIFKSLFISSNRFSGLRSLLNSVKSLAYRWQIFKLWIYFSPNIRLLKNLQAKSSWSLCRSTIRSKSSPPSAYSMIK